MTINCPQCSGRKARLVDWWIECEHEEQVSFSLFGSAVPGIVRAGWCAICNDGPLQGIEVRYSVCLVCRKKKLSSTTHKCMICGPITRGRCDKHLTDAQRALAALAR